MQSGCPKNQLHINYASPATSPLSSNDIWVCPEAKKVQKKNEKKMLIAIKQTR